MGQLIIQMERNVPAKGMDKRILPNQNKLKEQVFAHDYELVRSLLPLSINSQTPRMVYPGSGSDILMPLLFAQSLFPKITALHIQLIDLFPQEALVRTILDDIGIPFSEDKEKIQFYWHGVLINLDCTVANAFTLEYDHFDIYFERAFRIMKDQDPEFENRIFEKLNSSGVLISDSGFTQFPLEKIKVPTELSSYGEMVVGVKK